MIHLDRSHHHDLDQSQKQNLILSRDHDAPHFDWDDLSHTPDPTPFFHDPLHALQPLSPHNIHLHPDATISPAHPPHDLHDDKSSSLSPAPDSGSPPPQQNPAPLPLPQTLPHLPVPDKQEPDLAVEGTLTPLTELSPAPDLDDAFDDSSDDPKDSSHPIPSSASQDDHTRDRRVHPTVRINGTSSPPTSSASSPSRHLSTIDAFSARRNGTPAAAGSSHSRASSGDFLVPPLPSGLSAPAAGHPPSDPKATRILDINAELFKVCLEFQLRRIPTSDPRFQQYAMRLQVNLTWLAAAADQRHNSPGITLPIMEPPVAVEFASMDRIHHLYSDMSTIFAKDVARRQILNATHHGSPTAPTAAPNGALKRMRPDDLSDIASKRRDVGENKPQVIQAPPPVMSLSNAAPHPNPQITFPPPSQSNNVMSTVPAMPQSPRVSSPAMAPPSATPSLPFGATEASIAASTRARARELQIQQAREQQLRAAQMQQIQASRHMSPPSTSQQVPQSVAGGQSNPAFGPQAQHPSSILQNHNHPLMNYMIQQMPQFTSLPPQQQMQKLQVLQNFLAQRHQQQQQLQNSQVATPQRNPQMAGMAPNASIPMMSNGALSAGGGPSPVSPLAQQSPVMSQHQQHQQQQVMNSPAQNGMFPFGQGHTNSGMDPRMANSNFSSQMQGGMPNNMNVNQQRNLMLAQQQMRNTNGNMNAVPNMMNSQQHAYVMAQRMAQAGPSQPGSGVGGSPMSAPASDQFPALRSNSTIPGIARSARSPSDGVHSPMTPRTPSRLSQQPQLQQNDYSQAMMQHSHPAMVQNPGTFNPQVQNPNWPQSGQQPMQQQMGMVSGQMNGYSMNMNSPNNAGVGGFFVSTPSPSNHNWQQHQQGMTGSYPYGQSMGQHAPSDQSRLSHMAGMSIPQNMSPMVDVSGAPGEYDIFNYTGS